MVSFSSLEVLDSIEEGCSSLDDATSDEDDSLEVSSIEEETSLLDSSSDEASLDVSALTDEDSTLDSSLDDSCSDDSSEEVVSLLDSSDEEVSLVDTSLEELSS